MKEDIFTIVDSTFMPCGVECDQYSVIGEILELYEEKNRYTGESIYIMVLECNSLIITTAINKQHLLGEPGYCLLLLLKHVHSHFHEIVHEFVLSSLYVSHHIQLPQSYLGTS